MNSKIMSDVQATNKEILEEYPDKISYRNNFIDISDYLQEMHPHIFRLSDIMYAGISETIENDEHKIIVFVQLKNTKKAIEFKMPFSKNDLIKSKFFIIEIKQFG